MIRLGVNIDHVATLRQARRIREPDPAWAVVLAELGGADQITLHLREDRRHIQDQDLVNILRISSVPVNLEMAVTSEMIGLALAQEPKPHSATLVPERREEVATEGGLDAAGQLDAVSRAVSSLRTGGIRVSLFADPEPNQVEASLKAGAEAVELHTGAYCNAWGTPLAQMELARLQAAAGLAKRLGLAVHAGHGLNVRNVGPVAQIPEVEELNIGHSIVGRALSIGLQAAVAEMKSIIEKEAARK